MPKKSGMTGGCTVCGAQMEYPSTPVGEKVCPGCGATYIHDTGARLVIDEKMNDALREVLTGKTKGQTEHEAFVEECILEFHASAAKLTQAQFREALSQAMKSGDFMKCVGHVGDQAVQSVRYAPFAEKAALEAAVKHLKEALSMAYGLVVRHHNASKMVKLELGRPCPVCHDTDGAEDDFYSVYAAIMSAEGTKPTPEATRGHGDK